MAAVVLLEAERLYARRVLGEASLELDCAVKLLAESLASTEVRDHPIARVLLGTIERSDKLRDASSLLQFGAVLRQLRALVSSAGEPFAVAAAGPRSTLCTPMPWEMVARLTQVFRGLDGEPAQGLEDWLATEIPGDLRLLRELAGILVLPIEASLAARVVHRFGPEGLESVRAIARENGHTEVAMALDVVRLVAPIEAPQLASRHLKHRVAIVRASALACMSLRRGKRVTELLISSAENDRAEYVRDQAIALLGARVEDTLALDALIAWANDEERSASALDALGEVQHRRKHVRLARAIRETIASELLPGRSRSGHAQSAETVRVVTALIRCLAKCLRPEHTRAQSALCSVFVGRYPMCLRVEAGRALLCAPSERARQVLSKRVHARDESLGRIARQAIGLDKHAELDEGEPL
ncbi:MAG: hypothetical protein Q8Q09_17795 [Deltaproteobacteria bacterium]|nr:hypothetical protein [Deltaproteobacteria bacterium]